MFKFSYFIAKFKAIRVGRVPKIISRKDFFIIISTILIPIITMNLHSLLPKFHSTSTALRKQANESRINVILAFIPMILFGFTITYLP